MTTNKLGMPNFLTKSGYIAFDVLEEVQNGILKYNPRDLEKLCFWPAELVCSGYARQLLDALLTLYATRYLSRNLAVVEVVATRAALVHKDKYKAASARVRVGINDIVLTLAQQKPATYDMSTPVGDTHHHLIDTLGPTSDVGNMLIDVVGENLVDYPGFHLLCHLWVRMVHGDSRTALHLLDQLLQRHRAVEFEWDAVASVPKALRKDVVWVIWRMVHAIAKKLNTQYVEYTQSSLSMYLLNYSRKSRQDRINLLYACVVVCTRKKELLKNPLTNTASLVAKQIHLIYDQICPTKGKSTKKGHPQVREGSAKEGEGDVKDDKIKYLFCYSYKSDKSEPPASTIRPVQYKSIEVTGDLGIPTDQTIEVLKIS